MPAPLASRVLRRGLQYVLPGELAVTFRKSSYAWPCEALQAVVHYAFTALDLSRVESACLPENTASRGVLEKCGYKYEGVAQSYLQIDGRWRNHVLYANIRADRRGKSDAN